MTIDRGRLPRDAEASASIGRALVFAAYAALTASFLLVALQVAGSRSYWMDEVLAVWAARQPTVGAVIDAIWHGAEFSPPTYDLLLHATFGLFGDTRLVARLPSILAVLVTAGAMARLVARRLDPPLGVLVFGLVLGSGLFGFAVQARPYAPMLACQALALLVWEGWPPRAGTWRRGLLLAGLLAGAVAFHVYGILGLTIVAIAEALRTLLVQALRVRIWVSLAGAGLVSLAWWPLIHHLADFNTGDAGAPNFYARPTATRFLSALVDLSPDPRLVALIGVLAVGAVLLARGRAARPAGLGATDLPVDLAAMAVALVAALPVAFGLSLFVTHAFSTRYALPAALGFALAIALLLARCPFHKTICLIVVPLLCIAQLGRSVGDATAAAAALVAAAPGSGPIVVGEGLLFLELREAVPAPLRDRLVFLRTPPGVASPDPTNEHQVLRLKSFLPALPVERFADFVAAHPTFLEIVRSPSTADDIEALVAARHWPSRALVERPGAAIMEVRSAPDESHGR